MARPSKVPARAAKVRALLAKWGRPLTVAELTTMLRVHQYRVRTLLDTHPDFRRVSGDGTNRNPYRYTLSNHNRSPE